MNEEFNNLNEQQTDNQKKTKANTKNKSMYIIIGIIVIMALVLFFAISYVTGQFTEALNTFKKLDNDIMNGWTTSNGSHFLFENVDNWYWYESSKNLNDNYYKGYMKISNGEDALDELGISYDRALKLTVLSDENIKLNNIYCLNLYPTYLVSNGVNKTNTELTQGEFFKILFIIVDDYEAQAYNYTTGDTYYLTVGDTYNPMSDDMKGYTSIGKGISTTMWATGNFLIIFLCILIVILLFWIISYVLKSIALSNMAKDNNEKYSGLSWVPVINNIILSKLSFNNYYIGIIMIILSIINVCTSETEQTIPMLFLTISAVNWVLEVICTYKIYKKYSKNYVVLTVFTILTFGLSIPFMLFAIRKNNIEDKSEAKL